MRREDFKLTEDGFQPTNMMVADGCWSASGGLLFLLLQEIRCGYWQNISFLEKNELFSKSSQVY